MRSGEGALAGRRRRRKRKETKRKGGEREVEVELRRRMKGEKKFKRLLRRLSLSLSPLSLFPFSFSFFENHTPRSQPCRSSPAPSTRRQASPASSVPRPARAPAGECVCASRELLPREDRVDFDCCSRRASIEEGGGARARRELGGCHCRCRRRPLSVLLCSALPLLRRCLRLFEPSGDLEAKKTKSRGGGGARGGNRENEKGNDCTLLFPLAPQRERTNASFLATLCGAAAGHPGAECPAFSTERQPMLLV